MKHTIKGTIKDRKMKHTRIGQTIKDRRMKHAIEGTVKGRRMKHKIKGSFISYHVPQDIFTEILLRLPVKSLLRFKCVCKRWQDLIESSEFVTSHYNKMSTRRKSLIFIKFPPDAVFTSSSDNLKVSTFSSDNLEVSRYVDFPLFEYKRPLTSICFYGPSNGVWCLYDYQESTLRGNILHKGAWCLHDLKLESSHCGIIRNDYEYSSVGNNIALWNPATRELKALPKSYTRCPHLPDMLPYFWLKVNVGFGYDKNTNDYKVIKISQFSTRGQWCTPEQSYTRVDMYSLSNDYWREIDATVPISIRSPRYSSSASLKGIHYWLFTSVIILSFNISDEVFETIELPMPQENLETTIVREFDKLLVLHDSLALIVRNKQQHSFEVRKLKENNDMVKSWTKVSTISAHSNFRPRALFGFLEDGNAVMVGRCKLMLHDLETHVTKKTRSHGLFYDTCSLMHLYAESLVSLKAEGRLTTTPSFRTLACYDDIFPLAKYV